MEWLIRVQTRDMKYHYSVPWVREGGETRTGRGEG